MPDPMTNVGLRTYASQAVATLPPATSVPIGTRAFVNDCDTNNQVGRGKTVAGSGTFQAKVISNGAVWKVM